MNPFAISNILVLVTSLLFGYFVYSQQKERWVNRMWLIYSLMITIWGFFGLLIATGNDRELALLYWRLAMGFGVVWMPVLFHHFACLYAPWPSQREKRFLIIAYIITIILASLTFTPWFISEVKLVFGAFYFAKPNIVFHLMIIWWFAVLGYSHGKLHFYSRQMPVERRNQIKLFLIASVTAYVGGFLDFAIVYGFNWYPWGNFLIAVYPIVMTYAILRHGLFDIFIFIKRTVIIAVIIAFVAWVILGIGTLNIYFEQTFGLPPWVLPILAGILAVYIGHLFIKNANLTERTKEEFITVAAHKLRTPLTHIRHIADELSHSNDEKYNQELVIELKESNLLLIELVNKLLNAANLETRLESYKFGPFSLEELTTKVLRQLRSVTESKNINLTVNIAPDLVLAEGDKQNTDFVIQSLIENALTYTPVGGRVAIEIKRKGSQVSWSITDTGIGIVKEDLGMIFEKFFRSKEALLTDTEGTGLALFMSRNLIKRQGGTLNVNSDGENQGAHFWFTLPIYKK